MSQSSRCGLCLLELCCCQEWYARPLQQLLTTFLCAVFMYCSVFLSSLPSPGNSCGAPFLGDISLSCPLMLKLFHIDSEIITLAAFISHFWTRLTLRYKFVIGESFSSFSPNRCFCCLFLFFHYAGQVPLEGKLQFIMFFSFIATCTTTNYKLLLGWELLLAELRVHLNILARQNCNTISKPQRRWT